MAENSICFLVECLSMHDKRDFRRWAERNKRNPEYLVLFNEYNSLKEPDDPRVIRRMKVSKMRMAVLKTELREALFDFLAFAHDSYEASLYRILNTIGSLHRRSHFDYIPRLLGKGKALAKEYEDLLLLEKFLEKEATFPLSLQTDDYSDDRLFSRKAIMEESEMRKHTEDLISVISSEKPKREKANIVQNTHSIISSLNSEKFLTSKAQAQHFYNLRITSKFLGDLPNAIRFCRKYLNVLHKRRKVFPRYIYNKSKELVILAGLYLQLGMLKNHHKCIQLLLSLKGNGTIERANLFQVKYLPVIDHATNTGIFGVFSPHESQVLEGLEEFKGLIDEDFYLLISFYMAKYYTISGKYSQSNAFCQKRWEVSGKSRATTKLQNYFLILEMVNHYYLGNRLLLRSQLKSFDRYIRLEENPHRYFPLVSSLIKSLLKSSSKTDFAFFTSEFSKLRNDPNSILPFYYFDVVPWLSSLSKGESMKEHILDDYLSKSDAAKAHYMMTSKITTIPPPGKITR